MDQFIAEGKLPHFARLKAESQVYITDAEEIAPNLEPWIQWVTVETGLEGTDWVEVIGKLPENAQVVTTGQTQLAEGTPVEVRKP